MTIINLAQGREPLRPAPWPWTDDTAMALSICAVLAKYGGIDEDQLARSFSQRYAAQPRRGYGPAMHRLLPQLRDGKTRHKAARGLFGGQGSFGNGSAMRVAPVGAFFADDLDATIEHARRSALVTHTHPEGIAGAIAVAVAAAWAWRLRGAVPPRPEEFLDLVLASIPTSEVAAWTRQARNLAASRAPLRAVVDAVGNGSEVSCQDTVPFVLWSAAQNLGNYEEALWQTVSGLGDMDTTCAMVGGIVALYTGLDGIPEHWRRDREPLPEWFTQSVLGICLRSP
ncbi:MAG: ADP-ribosylglycohydrolase family protein [Chloroflexota bacterium]|nr:ADP-ribosylglycohydrolase family protein [Chloroflexota bacterium]